MALLTIFGYVNGRLTKTRLRKTGTSIEKIKTYIKAAIQLQDIIGDSYFAIGIVHSSKIVGLVMYFSVTLPIKHEN